jgi:alpha-aminoadipate carrier protein LysW
MRGRLDMAEGYCPDCDSPIKLGDNPRKGQHVTCPSCSAYLQVTGVSPIELDWAQEDEEEYEYEVEYDYDDDDMDDDSDD